MDKETDVALTILAQSLSSALSEVARLKADRWELLKVLQDTSPELHETFVQPCLSEQYLAILDAASFEIARVSAIPSRP
jgi:hypothetical protein